MWQTWCKNEIPRRHNKQVVRRPWPWRSHPWNRPCGENFPHHSSVSIRHDSTQKKFPLPRPKDTPKRLRRSLGRVTLAKGTHSTILGRKDGASHLKSLASIRRMWGWCLSPNITIYQPAKSNDDSMDSPIHCIFINEIDGIAWHFETWEAWLRIRTILHAFLDEGCYCNNASMRIQHSERGCFWVGLMKRNLNPSCCLTILEPKVSSFQSVGKKTPTGWV